MSIPDPVELMEARREREQGKVGLDGKYPCIECGRRFPVEQMICVDPMGVGPLVCGEKGCVSEEISKQIEEMSEPEKESWKQRIDKFLDWLSKGWEHGDGYGGYF